MQQKCLSYLEDTFELGDIHVCVVICLVRKKKYNYIYKDQDTLIMFIIFRLRAG